MLSSDNCSVVSAAAKWSARGVSVGSMADWLLSRSSMVGLGPAAAAAADGASAVGLSAGVYRGCCCALLFVASWP